MHTFVSKYASSRRVEERYCYVKLYYYVKRSTETNIHICNLRGNIAELAIFCLGYQRRRRCALHPQHKSHHKVMSIKLLNNTFSISNLSGKIVLMSYYSLCVWCHCTTMFHCVETLKHVTWVQLSGRETSPWPGLLPASELPNGPFPCDLKLFRQITQKQIREI